MNEQTEKLINEALAGAIEAAKKTGNFVIEQAPDLIQQLVLYKTWEYSLIIAISLGWFITSYFLIKWAIKKIEDTDGGTLAVIIVAIILDLVSIIAFFNTLFDLVKIVVAPKVWLLEYAAMLLK